MTYPLKIQLALRSGTSPDDLNKQFAITHKKHPKFNNLILFKYNQIESPFSEQIVRESRGLILDESDNYKVICHSFNKFFNYGEGHAATISWDTAKVFDKLDGCFLYDTSLHCWDGSKIDIGKVVKNKLKPTLIGMDSQGNIVPCEVLDWFDNGTKSNWLEILISLKHSGKNIKFKVTDNHHIFLNGKFQSAGLAKPGDKVISYTKHFADHVMHMIESSLLGDGSLSKNGASFYFKEAHKIEHNQYVIMINSWLGDAGNKPYNFTSGFGSKMTQVVSTTSDQLIDLRNKWYPNGKKIVPDDLSWIDDFSIAKWYMDDGSLAHSSYQNDRALFATNGFSKIEVQKLAKKLTEMYGVNCTVYNSKGWCIRVNSGRKSTIDAMWSAIAPHIVECMKYKLPLKFRNVKYIPYKSGGKILKSSKEFEIISINKLDLNKRNFPNGKIGFDIKTTTSNYFCNGLLVHNSLCQLYYYDGSWQVATSGSPDAGGNVGNSEIIFRDLFFKTFFAQGGTPVNQNYCYSFELTGPLNRVVVVHDARVTLIAARDLITGKEVSLDEINDLNIPKVKSYSLNSFAEIQETFEKLSPLSYEGYIVVDDNFNRVKIKHPGYVALHHMKDKFSPRSMVEVARSGEISEVVNAFPEFIAMLSKIDGQLNQIISQIEWDYSRIKEAKSQKDFAILATQTRFQNALFLLRSGKVKSPRDYLNKIKIDNLLEFLGINSSKEL